MNPLTKPTRTADEKAAEEAIRRQNMANPIRAVPAGAINRESFESILRLLAKLKAAREKQGLTVASVATRMGIDATGLEALETGKTLNPTLATLCKWAESLGQKLSIEVTDD